MRKVNTDMKNTDMEYTGMDTTDEAGSAGKFQKEGGRKCMRGFREFLAEEDGVGVVEIILILVVLIGLVMVFKTQLTTLVNNIFSKINANAGKIYK